MRLTADAASSFTTGRTTWPERMTSFPCTVYIKLSNTEYQGIITSWWRTCSASTAWGFPVAVAGWFLSGGGAAAELLLADRPKHIAKTKTPSRLTKLLLANFFIALPLFGPLHFI